MSRRPLQVQISWAHLKLQPKLLACKSQLGKMMCQFSSDHIKSTRSQFQNSYSSSSFFTIQIPPIEMVAVSHPSRSKPDTIHMSRSSNQTHPISVEQRRSILITRICSIEKRELLHQITSWIVSIKRSGWATPFRNSTGIRILYVAIPCSFKYCHWIRMNGPVRLEHCHNFLHKHLTCKDH